MFRHVRIARPISLLFRLFLFYFPFFFFRAPFYDTYGCTEHGRQTYLAKEQPVDTDRRIKRHLSLENCRWAASPLKVLSFTQFTYSLPRQIVNTLLTLYLLMWRIW